MLDYKSPVTSYTGKELETIQKRCLRTDINRNRTIGNLGLGTEMPERKRD
jgi:hypothetical protein